MQENNQTNNPAFEPKIVQTDAGVKDGQNKCPKCGATDISFNANTSLLRCNFCRHEFEPEKSDAFETDLSKLEGIVVGSGAQNIAADSNDVLTLKCTSCGSEVVIDTASAYQARCHWCRNTLSVNQTIPNGTVPDLILPFQLKKEEAKEEIQKFVKKRKFFAHPKFKKEFCTENVMGVYLPYMVIDINANANFAGQGEIQTRKYSSGNKNKTTYYDADVYDVEREFDIIIEGLTVESSADKLNIKAKNKTNNIINSIMPFDTENCVKWNPNYLKGFTSEKRDTNVDQLSSLVQTQAKDVTRHKTNDTLKQYDRGVAWSKQDFNIKGKQWKAAYLPVWLYSYHQKEKDLMHYVAVNARTKETMGSVPINQLRLILVSALVTVLGVILWALTSPFFAAVDDTDLTWLFLFIGVIFYFACYSKYRNQVARHFHEKETKSTMSNLRKSDVYVTERKKLTKPKIIGVNNKSIDAFVLTDNNFLAKYQKQFLDGYGDEPVKMGFSFKKN